MVVSEEVGWRWLNHPWLTQIGVWSYSLYLYHAWGWIFGDSLSARPAASVLLGTAGSFVLAIASYRYVERPALALRQRLEQRWWPTDQKTPEPKDGRMDRVEQPPELIPPSGS